MASDTNAVVRKVEIPRRQLGVEFGSNLPKYSVDLVGIVTGVLIDDPEADVHFMFESKEGVRLPDTTGEISQELKRKPLSYRKINDLLWDQAVIWPLAHFARGFWARGNLDFSLINTSLPPTAFEWIGLK